LHLKFNNPENANFLANSGLFFCNLINQVLNRRGFQDFRKTLFKSFKSSNVASVGVTGASNVSETVHTDFAGPSTPLRGLLRADTRLIFEIIKARTMMILVFILFEIYYLFSNFDHKTITEMKSYSRLKNPENSQAGYRLSF